MLNVLCAKDKLSDEGLSVMKGGVRLLVVFGDFYCYVNMVIYDGN
jgi:hypothetical protein